MTAGESRGPAETIFARASGAGRAGVAVFRLSGPAAFSITRQFIRKEIKLRTPVLARLEDPASGETIDEGLVLLFEGPASYTGEDTAEFHLHGARAVEEALFSALAGVGARPAEAGEFTMRALKNGKLDLAQAEALADLIDSETRLQKKQALGQYSGRLSEMAETWRAEILAILAPLEADIDFPDEGDVPAAVAARAGPAIERLAAALERRLKESIRTRRIRDGLSIAVIGAPNAGKSSLMNALAGESVAIVSATPGTTRDVLEVRLDLGGLVATLADTAGIRTRTNDPIEAEGVKRARAKAETADVRVLVVDPGTSPVDGEMDGTAPASLAPGDFLIWSKADLGRPAPATMPVGEGVHVFTVSAKTGEGLDPFLAALTEEAGAGALGDGADNDGGEGGALTRVRHVQAVETALAALRRAEVRVASAPELAAEDARMAARALGGITGAVGVEDVLGEIFSSFCIGK
ncbi:MAG: tRNA uridine-5-carboxymethylaminomethyl(34) synthesis GTPase MnmE [Pseudomonadota bacterium]